MSYQLDSDSSKENITLFVRQFSSAKKTKAAVILVTGGPGESGASMYSQLETIRRSFPDTDIFIPDHRGTGFSTRICAAEEAVESAGGARLEGAEWGSCFASMHQEAKRTRQFSITNAAHDLDKLIALVHAENTQRPIYLYGVSYGTQLILRLFQLDIKIGVASVKGVILDSLVPMQTAETWDLTHRSHVVDMIGRKVLAECDADKKCHAMMETPSEQVLVQLLRQLQGHPELLTKIPGKNLKLFLGRLLDFPILRDRIPYLIKDLANGQENELKKVLVQMEKAYSVLGDFPQLAPSIPLVSTINGSENNLRPTLTEAQLHQEEEELLFTDAIPGLMLDMTLPKYEKDTYYGKEPQRFPPTLVLMGDMDPKTHFDGAVEHVQALRKNGMVRIVKVKRAPHFIAMFAPECFSQSTRAFITGKLKHDRVCEL
ncbi:alpha/beta fold hydrolase [Undibacterium flavidum]|uniref:Alpha/beta fold hydrolase n=1 Tax=Undibacterium flavidum TaxID=2762297 RepID=A0ABR6YDT4_9BURK|nr:alpha/beta fold hydrolase [Undibacterium flavidum]MBC3874718.1 alpha/beta fold hydrolase [Undibacterium flavidum]